MTADAPHAADYLTELAGIISSRRTECAGQISAAASALVHATLVEASRWLVDHGHEPPIRRSRNLPGGEEHNTAVAARYLDRLPELRWI
jgi:uncharacterized phosphosugar-binding protein